MYTRIYVRASDGEVGGGSGESTFHRLDQSRFQDPDRSRTRPYRDRSEIIAKQTMASDQGKRRRSKSTGTNVSASKPRLL